MANSDYIVRPQSHGFCPVGYLTADIGHLDSSLTMTNYTSPIDDGVRLGMAAMITSVIPNDPHEANVILLVQGGENGSLAVQDLSSYGDLVTINNYAVFDGTHSVLGANTIKTTRVAAGIDPFMSTGSTSRFGRAPGDKISVECWVYIGVLENYAGSSWFFTWWGPGGRILEVGSTGAIGTPSNLRLRNGDGLPIESTVLSAGLHFIQLNIDDGAYTLDLDGVQAYSGINNFEVGVNGIFSFHVASQTPTGIDAGPLTQVWVSPLRMTKGVLRPRGSVPTAPFQAQPLGFNQEIVEVVDQVGNLLTLARGCCDTIPSQHSAGDAIWFFDDSIGGDKLEYAGTETIGVKVLPRTTTTTLPVEYAPPAELQFNLRFARPYPPGLVEVNGAPWFTTPLVLSLTAPALVITWAHRDRVTQQDQLIDHLEASVGPEIGTTYELRVYRENGTPLRMAAGVTTTSWTYSFADAVGDFSGAGGSYPGYITLCSRRDGLTSYQQYRIDFTLESSTVVSPPPNPPLVGSIISNATTIAVPTHAAGDAILVIHRSPAIGAPPTTLAGFTSLATTNPTFVFASRAQWALDVSNTITSISNPDGSTLSIHVFTDCAGVGDVQVRDANDVGVIGTFPTLTLSVTDGSSSAFACLISNQSHATRPSNPPSMTKLTDAQTPTNYGGGDFVTWLSDDGVTSFAGVTTTWPTTAYWTAYSIELLAVAAPTPPDTTEDTLTLTVSLPQQEPGVSISMNLTQVATPISAGSAYVAIFYIPLSLQPDPVPAGRTIYVNFGMGVSQAISIETVLSYTTTAVTSHADVINALIGQANAATPLSSRGLAATANAYTGRPGMQISGPVGLRLHSTYGVMVPGVLAPVFSPASNLVAIEFSLGSPVVPVALNQMVTVTLSGSPAPGDRFTVTLNGVVFAHTASTGATLSSIAAALAAEIDADTNYAASAAGAVITIDGLTPANVFSYSALSESLFAF